MASNPAPAPNSPKGLFDLPPELRETIFRMALATGRDTYIVLPAYKRFYNEEPATQPAICTVSRQLRAETLHLFYRINLFSASLDNPTDLLTAQNWLAAIGDDNVSDLRRLALCGWTRVPFGHMVTRRYIRLELDLVTGEMDMGTVRNAHPVVTKRVDDLDEAFHQAMVAREGAAFDGQSIGAIMAGFSRLCKTY